MDPRTPDAAAPDTPRSFDTDHAVVVIVVGSLLFLFAIRRGFRGLVVGVS